MSRANASNSPTGSARRRAARTLEILLATRQPATRHLAVGASGLADAERRLYFELVLGTLRWLLRVDGVLTVAAKRPVSEIDLALRGPLRVAAYQLLFLEREPAFAVVNEAVEDVKERGLGHAAGFANAVLRRIAGRGRVEDWPVEGAAGEVQCLAVESSHPEFLVRGYVERFGSAGAAEILSANNQKRPLHLLCLGPREEVARELAAAGVSTRPARLSPLGLEVTAGDALGSDALRAGRVYVQDDASQAAALVPLPEPGERVLDAAAAPGGKSLALVAFDPSLRVVAADASLPRLARLASNLRRARRGVRILASDLERTAVRSVFDRVVVDLPCSGTGTLARHPELKWRVSADEIARLASRGLRLLSHAADLVCPGGLLCAVTCSIELQENEAVVSELTARRRDLEPLSLHGRVPPRLADGLGPPGLWRVLPHPAHDGFTVQVLRRGRSEAGGSGR